ncbi:hypothetical protein PHLH6_39140 [Pseudomonas sp. Seg1]|nr:hypothetical protein PHLH6_39140 [Pseudomonas sp. Seg1]
MTDRCDFFVENSFYLLWVVIFSLSSDGFVIYLVVDKRIG